MKIILILVSFFFGIPVVLSQDEIILTIGDRSISRIEFERLYNKNKFLIKDETQDMEEFLERFINFKLKVTEAESLGYDTTGNFLKELNAYRKELIKPYMLDTVIREQFYTDAYKRMLKDLEVSHILINLDPKASPEDTIAAWNNIMLLRSDIINGEDFSVIAEQKSDDPSARTNKGYLGWFTVFQMVYEFEKAAYSTLPGSISMPVRTRFGYHIIKVQRERPARGSVQVAHIFISVPEDSPEDKIDAAKEKIYSLHDSLINGASFKSIVRVYSDDRSTATSGGELPWFTIGKMIPEFENAAFSLEIPGQISEPVKSFYGWHIIKLMDKKPVGSFEKEREVIEERMNSASFSKYIEEKFIKKLKEIHNFKLSSENLNIFYAIVDTSIFNARWRPEKYDIPNDVLFSIGDILITQRDFAGHLEKMQHKIPPYDIKVFINDEFKKFSEGIVYKYEESLLEDRYPEIKYILQEYHDGILLFDLTDKMVWSKAVKDTSGLEDFFYNNIENYKWNNRADAYIINVKDPALLARARRLTSKNAGNMDFSEEMLARQLCPDDTVVSCVEIISGKFERGDNEHIDAARWKKGLGKNIEHNGVFSFRYIRRILPPEYKKLEETRGLVLTDYQEFLDKEWIDELRNKYPVFINREVVSKITE